MFDDESMVVKIRGICRISNFKPQFEVLNSFNIKFSDIEGFKCYFNRISCNRKNAFLIIFFDNLALNNQNNYPPKPEMIFLIKA